MHAATHSKPGGLYFRLPGNRHRLTVRREDRDGQLRRRRERQLVQVMPLIEGIRRCSRVSVEVELRAQQPNVCERVELRPTAAACRNELPEARRSAWEVT